MSDTKNFESDVSLFGSMLTGTEWRVAKWFWYAGRDSIRSATTSVQGGDSLDNQVPKFYVASRASIPERAAMWRRLRDSGVAVVSTWIDEAGEDETADFGELWQRIVSEVRACTSLILYAEPDDFPLKGALLEVGMALGMGKRVYVVSPGVALEKRSMRPLGSWLHHPLVTHCNSVEYAVELGSAALRACPPNAPIDKPDPLEQTIQICSA